MDTSRVAGDQTESVVNNEEASPIQTSQEISTKEEQDDKTSEEESRVSTRTPEPSINTPEKSTIIEIDNPHKDPTYQPPAEVLKELDVSLLSSVEGIDTT